MVSKKIIVVVDDEPGLCETIQDCLEDEGFEARIAADGQAALTILRALDRRPCMILCDLIMPRMDGPALYKAVKADTDLKSIPFFFMSTDPSRAPPGELVMRKPVNLEVMLNVVRNCCGSVITVAS